MKTVKLACQDVKQQCGHVRAAKAPLYETFAYFITSRNCCDKIKYINK